MCCPHQFRAHMKIAVVGSGLAGLHIAWLLSCEEHFDPNVEGGLPEVHLIERAATLGMDAASVNVLDGKARVDVPMRGFFSGYYPKLVRLYGLVKVAITPAYQTLGFFALRDTVDMAKAEPAWLYTPTTFAGINVPVTFRPSALLADVQISLAWAWFIYYCSSAATHREDSLPALMEMTIEDYLIEKGFSKTFREDVLYGFLASICTCSVDDMKNYPAFVVLEFFGMGVFTEGMHVVQRGVQEVCKTLSKRVHKISLSSPVEWVESFTDTDGVVRVHLKMATKAEPDVFDHVIFASQANHALAMLRNPTSEEKAALSAFTYVKSSMVVHTDTSFMPGGSARSDWQMMNFVTFHDEQNKAIKVTSNQLMNSAFASIANDKPVISTWNAFKRPAEGTLISESLFERPLVTIRTPANLKRLWQIQGSQSKWFVGAYAYHGIPLLEGCVESGLLVAKNFGVRESRVYYSAAVHPTASTSNGQSNGHVDASADADPEVNPCEPHNPRNAKGMAKPPSKSRIVTFFMWLYHFVKLLLGLIPSVYKQQ